MNYSSHLSKDRKLKKLVDTQEKHVLRRKNNLCMQLCESIISQQLSARVSAVIFQRFLNLFKNGAPIPEEILALSYEQLRGIGLSDSKVNYIHNVARFAIEKGLETNRIRRMNEEEIIAYLTAIKGVGRWTVEMIMMFSMGREDVFPVDDLGIQNAMEKLYNIDKSDKKKFRQKMQAIASKWSPYRTYACLLLWKWKDEKKITIKTSYKKEAAKKAIKKK